MKDRINTQIIKAAILAIAFLVFYLQSCSVNAQGLKRFVRDYQLGFEGAFGIKYFTINSNIEMINNLNVVGEGGTVGILLGAKALRLKFRHGYYYSSSSVAHTIDEVRSAFVANFYPLLLETAIHSKIQPYLVGGLENNVLKMYGTYGPDNSAPINYSVTEAPYLGKISNIVASVGAGLEYRVESPGYFVAIFGEARYGKSLSINSSTSFFEQTSTSNQMLINFGVGFGYHR